MAARHNVEQLKRELVELRAAHDHLATAWTGEHAAREEAERQATSLRDSLDRVARSKSWRLTAPLRAVTAAAKRLR